MCIRDRIKEILVKEGDKIKVGQVIFTADNNGAAAVAEPARKAEPSSKGATATPVQSPSGERAAAATKLQPSSPVAPTSQSAPQPTRATGPVAASEFRLQELGENISAVSYTHLDVYKRQVQPCVKSLG